MNKDYYGHCSDELISKFTRSERSYKQLLASLPPLVASLISEIVSKGITLDLIEVAYNLNYLGYGNIEVVDLLVKSDWKNPPRCKVLALVVAMIESQ